MNTLSLFLGTIFSLGGLENRHFQIEINKYENTINQLKNKLNLLNEKKYKWYELEKKRINKKQIKQLKSKIMLENERLIFFLGIRDVFLKVKSIKISMGIK